MPAPRHPVPEDVQILGFGDVEIGRQCVPRLSTIAVDAAEIGLRTGALLLGLLDGGAEAPPVIDLGFRLVLRRARFRCNPSGQPGSGAGRCRSTGAMASRSVSRVSRAGCDSSTGGNRSCSPRETPVSTGANGPLSGEGAASALTNRELDMCSANLAPRPTRCTMVWFTGLIHGLRADEGRASRGDANGHRGPASRLSPAPRRGSKAQFCAVGAISVSVAPAGSMPMRPQPGSFRAGRRRSSPATAPRTLISIPSTQPRVRPR